MSFFILISHTSSNQKPNTNRNKIRKDNNLIIVNL